jgi:hypothetical protein
LLQSLILFALWLFALWLFALWLFALWLFALSVCVGYGENTIGFQRRASIIACRGRAGAPAGHPRQ